MIIRNREELAKQLNNHAVETFLVKNKPGRKIMNTIVYNKLKDKFYKIEWGEIIDENLVNFLWFEKEAKEVVLNPKGVKGWFTKEQSKSVDIKQGDDYMEINKLLSNVESNIVNIGNLKHNQISGKKLTDIELVGTKAGKGKTWYAIKEVVEAMVKKDKILFFSTETSKKEIIDRLVKVIIGTDIVRELWDNSDNKTVEKKNKMALDFINQSSLIIDDNPLLDNNCILSKMRETNKSTGLDFVVIDSLKKSLNPKAKNTMEIHDVLKQLENEAYNLGCKILVTTQLNSNF